MATNQQRREAAKRKLERQIVRRAERARRRKVIGIGLAAGAVIVIAGLVVFLVSQNSGPSVAAPSNPNGCEFTASAAEPASKPVNAPPNGEAASTGTAEVTIKTTAGDIPVTLNRALAPCAVTSFLSLAKQGFYTDTQCHRLSTTGLHMLQCGDPSGSGSGGPGYTYKDEVTPDLKYGRGVLAMANAGPDTNGSQFFMVYGEADLPPSYTVFGNISEAGLQVIDKVASGGDDGSFDPSPGGGKPNIEVKFTEVITS